MKKAETIIEFLETIEPDDDAVIVRRGAKAIVNLESEDITLNGVDCQKAFKDQATAELFFEKLGSPDDAQIEFHGVTLDPDVVEFLEDIFSDVEVY